MTMSKNSDDIKHLYVDFLNNPNLINVAVSRAKEHSQSVVSRVCVSDEA